MRKTNMRFKNIDAFDKYIGMIDRKYDIDDDIIYEGNSYILLKKKNLIE